MRRGDFNSQTLYILITILIAISAAVDNKNTFIFLIWLGMLGILQIFHSIILGSENWQTRPVRIALIIYWFAAATDLIIFFTNASTVTLFYIPLTLALYLWGITLWGRFHKKPPPLEARTA